MNTRRLSRFKTLVAVAALCSFVSTARAGSQIVAAEQAEARYVVLDADAPAGYLWEWKPALDVVDGVARLSGYEGYFSNPSCVKPRSDGKLLVAASAGGFARIDLKTCRADYFGQVAKSENVHMMEELPDGRVALACSTGCKIILVDLNGYRYDPNKHTQKTAYSLSQAHGVVWDGARNCLWAIGEKVLVKLAYDATEMTLSPVSTYDFNAQDLGLYGHDLFFSADGKLTFTTDLVVGKFDPETETFATYSTEADVKSISFGADGDLRTIPTTSWWTDTLKLGDRSVTRAGAKFYKSRYLPDGVVVEEEKLTWGWTGDPVDLSSTNLATKYQGALVAQYDGIDNVGTGAHDASTNIWKNLAPSDTTGSYDLTLMGKGSWGEGWLNVDGPSAMGVENQYPANYKTIEILYRSAAKTGRIMFYTYTKARWAAFTEDGDKLFFTADAKEGAAIYQFSDEVPFDANRDWSVAAVYDGDTPQVAYTNGVSEGSTTYKSGTWGNNYKSILLGGRKTSSEPSKEWKGRIYAIRLHSAMLTSEQLVNNSLLDRARYLNDPEAIKEVTAKRLSVDAIPTQLLLGESCEPAVVVRDRASGAVLQNGIDYTFAYLDNTAPGLGTVKVIGLGEYAKVRVPELKIRFRIAELIRVRENATGSGASWEDATSWTNALARASTSAHASEIWVAGDVAVPNGDSYSFVEFVTIRGGFAGTEKVPSERPASARSVVDGQDTYNTFTFGNMGLVTLDSLYFTRGYNRGVRKQESAGDLIVTNCAFNLNGTMGGTWSTKVPTTSGSDATPMSEHGCGANFIGKSGAKLTVVNCDFSGNTTCDQMYDTGSGGGACIANFAQATIDGCTFTTNHVVTRYRKGWSSALQLIATPARVTGCAFRGNAAPTPNGSVVNAYGACGGTVFENCLFAGNTCGKSYGTGKWYSYHTGAGEICFDMDAASAKAAVKNCTFAYNYARKSATLTVKKGDVDVRNTIFWANVSDPDSTYATPRGTEVHCHTNGTVSADWILIGGTNEHYVSSLVTNAVRFGEHVLTCDPELVTPTADYTNLMKVATMPYTGWTKKQLDGLVFDPSRAAYNVHLRGTYVDELTGMKVSTGKRSPAVDAGAPSDGYANEPKPNGKRINLGCYGNTPWATRSKLTGFKFIVE